MMRVDRYGNLRQLLREGSRVPYQGDLYTLLGIGASPLQSLGVALDETGVERGVVAISAVALVLPLTQFIGKVTIVDEAPACRVDLDGDHSAGVGDLFAFLNGWFAGTGDFNGDGTTTVQDIFDFLSAWFAGCPA